MSVERLQVQQKDPVGETVWQLERTAAALQALANDPQPFFRTEIQDMRRVASDLLMIACQAEANMKFGSR
jgi:acyl dehydratase